MYRRNMCCGAFSANISVKVPRSRCLTISRDRDRDRDRDKKETREGYQSSQRCRDRDSGLDLYRQTEAQLDGYR
jgi:hypothetical protein